MALLLVAFVAGCGGGGDGVGSTATIASPATQGVGTSLSSLGQGPAQVALGGAGNFVIPEKPAISIISNSEVFNNPFERLER